MTNKTYHMFFRNLSNPIRTRIIMELKNNPSSVNELSEKLDIEQSKLSHALASLKLCNFVDFEQRGKQRIYSLNKTVSPILEMIDLHAQESCKCKECSMEYCEVGRIK